METYIQNLDTKRKNLQLDSLVSIGNPLFITVILIYLLFFTNYSVFSQSGLCDSGVPFFNVNLSASPDAVWTSPNVSRQNLCCGQTGVRCIEFQITLHPDAIAINFNIASGAIPPGSMFYQIDCGPPVVVGEPVCLSGVGPHTLTFCKPGNNANTYSVTSIPNPNISNPDFATENCPAQITMTGMTAGTIAITDLSGGGANLSYLSCTNCLNPIVRPFGNFPAYADYEICGTPSGSMCLASSTYCETVRVYFYDTISATINPNPASFCPEASGVWLHSNISSGVPPYTYEWYNQSNGAGTLIATTENYFATSVGNYSLLVYDSLYPHCGYSVRNVTVTKYSSTVIGFSSQNPYFCEGGSVNITATGASDYVWSPPDGLSTTLGALVTASPDNTTTYTVTGTDSHGCSASGSVTVQVCDAPNLTTNADGDVCLGDSYQLVASGAMLYEWTPTTGLNNSSIANPIATPSVTTEYVVTGFDPSCTVISNGDFSNGNTGFTTQYNYNANLYTEGNYMIGTNPHDYHSNFSACNDHTPGTGNMMIVNGNTLPGYEVWCQDVIVYPNTDYIFSTWITSVHPTNPAVLQFSINGNLLGSPFTATTTTCNWNEFYEIWNSESNTSIQICVVNQNTIANGNDFAIDDIYFAPMCTATDTVVVTVHNPAVISFSNVGPFCESDPSTNIVANPTGGVWAGPGITNVNTGTFDPGTAGDGTHTISYSIINGACSDDDNINVIVDGYTSVSIAPINAMCLNDPAQTLTANIGGGIWSGIGISNPTIGIFDPAVSGTGTFVISYSFISGSCISNTTTNVIVNPSPNAIIANLEAEYCQFESALVLVVSPPGGTLSGPGINGPVFNPSIAGPGVHTIQYSVTNIFGCSDVETATVTVHEASPVSIAIPDLQFCLDDPTADLSGTPPGGIFEGTGVLGVKFFPTIAGPGEHQIAYTVVDENGCENSTSQIVEVAQPIVIALNGTNLTCNGVPTGTVSATVTGGVPTYSYLWDDPSASTSETVENLTNGTFTLLVIDSWGCDGTATITITQPTLMNVSISSSTNPRCNGDLNGNAYVAATGGTPPYQYLWDDASNSFSPMLNNIGAGTYSVTVTDNFGCSGTASVSLTQSEILVAAISSHTDVSCNGGHNGSATVSASGGTEPYSYLWNNPSHTPLATANHLSAGNYTVTITDAHACSTEANVIITESSVITATTSSQDLVCSQHLGSASIIVNGGETPYSYHWSSGNTTNTATDLNVGTHYVTVTDAQNCELTSSITINRVGSIHANIIQNGDILCYAQAGVSLTAYSYNGVAPFSFMWSNGINTVNNLNLTAGHYELIISDAWGCTGSDSHDVDDAGQIFITAQIIASGCAGGETGSISLEIIGGKSPYYVTWEDGSHSTTLTGLSQGNYQVTVLDGNSCSETGDYTVINPLQPLRVSLYKKDVNCAGGNDGSINLSASGGTPDYIYRWEFNNNYFTGASAASLSPGIYNITIIDSQGCDMDTAVVIGEPQAMEYSFITINPSCIGNNDGYIEISIIGGNPPYNIHWADQTSPIPYISGLMQGNYLFTVIDNGGCTLSTEEISLMDDNTECLKIPNAFTPNNDGVNDTWIIENIELFPWALIQVFNRWGQEIFEGKGSGEQWDGTWNNKVVPTGSYLYTIDLFNGTKYCGIVTIMQ